MSLRDYFSEPSPWDLLSISYNPDARYAFVNFSSESARLSAIRQAASRLFDGRRLDCRIRHESMSRSTKVNYGLDTNNTNNTNTSNSNKRGLLHPSSPICCGRAKSLWSKVEEFSHFPEADRASWGKEKYFILKSFSLEALYQSLETGRWHVPKRHVERLNHAFQTANKVYLIFSVNGSGCFFGYATMRAEIRVEEDDPAQSSDEIYISRRDFDVDDDFVSSQLEGQSCPRPATRLRTESLASASSSSSASSASSASSSSSGSIIYQPERRRIVWEASWSQRTIRESASPGEDLPAMAPGPTSSYFANTPPSSTQPLSTSQSSRLEQGGGSGTPPTTAGSANNIATATATTTVAVTATTTTQPRSPFYPHLPPPRESETETQSETESGSNSTSKPTFLRPPRPNEHSDSDASFLSTLDRFSSPCAIKWLSTQSLPFSAVRGLTNPWNADKEVHVARNVTPLEPGVAAALLGCWGVVAAGKKTRERVRVC